MDLEISWNDEEKAFHVVHRTTDLVDQPDVETLDQSIPLTIARNSTCR